jgi:hypothetical protein
MNWLNTALQAAQIGLEIGQLSQLQKMNDRDAHLFVQQLNHLAKQGIIDAARNELFKLNTLASLGLDIPAEKLIAAAAIFKYLDLRLMESRITADLFSEIGDKKYFQEIKQCIATNLSRLTRDLSSAERTEINQVAVAAHSLPEIKYYLSIYKDAKKYQHAKSIVDDPRNRRYNSVTQKLDKSGFGKFSNYLMIAFIALAPFSLISNFTYFLIAAAIFWSLTYLLVKKKIQEQNDFENYQYSRKIIEQFQNTINLEQFNKLERDYGNDQNMLVTKKREAEALVQRFFVSNDKINLELMGV